MTSGWHNHWSERSWLADLLEQGGDWSSPSMQEVITSLKAAITVLTKLQVRLTHD